MDGKVMGVLREAMGAERELWGEWIMDFCEVDPKPAPGTDKRVPL